MTAGSGAEKKKDCALLDCLNFLDESEYHCGSVSNLTAGDFANHPSPMSLHEDAEVEAPPSTSYASKSHVNQRKTQGYDKEREAENRVLLDIIKNATDKTTMAAEQALMAESADDVFSAFGMNTFLH
ncbi:hypothetical protein OSTOST_20692 [Ostertagia ostertagi]